MPSMNHRRPAMNPATKAKAVKMLQAGHAGAEVAKALGISLPSVQNLRAQAGLVKQSQPVEPASQSAAGDILAEIVLNLNEAVALLENEEDAQHSLERIYDLVDDLKKVHPPRVAEKPARKKR